MIHDYLVECRRVTQRGAYVFGALMFVSHVSAFFAGARRISIATGLLSVCAVLAFWLGRLYRQSNRLYKKARGDGDGR